MRVVIFSNGNIENYEYYKDKITQDDFIICADGAIRHCINIGVVPNLWIGDFDSCNLNNYLENYPYLKNVNRITLNPQKDETDTHYACNVAVDHGCDEIIIFGALGKRMDHAFSNVCLLEMLASKNIKASIEDEKNRITIFKDSYNTKKERRYLSLIPMDKKVTVLKTSGLLYPLENYIMDRCLSLGVSNEITGEFASVSIEGGAMLCVESDD